MTIFEVLKRRNPRRSCSTRVFSTQSRGRSAKHWRKHLSAQTEGRAINIILFAQPLIKVSTAAAGEVLVARIKRSFEGDVCVRQVYLLMSTNITLRHAVPLAINTTLKTKKERNSRSSLMVPRAGVEPAQG